MGARATVHPPRCIIPVHAAVWVPTMPYTHIRDFLGSGYTGIGYTGIGYTGTGSGYTGTGSGYTATRALALATRLHGHWLHGHGLHGHWLHGHGLHGHGLHGHPAWVTRASGMVTRASSMGLHGHPAWGYTGTLGTHRRALWAPTDGHFGHPQTGVLGEFGPF